MTHRYLIENLRTKLKLTDPESDHFRFIEEVDSTERIHLLLILETLIHYQLFSDDITLVPRGTYTTQPKPCANQMHISLRRSDTGQIRDFARIAFINRGGKKYFFVSFYSNIMNLNLSEQEYSASAANETDKRFSPIDLNQFLKHPEHYLKSPAEIVAVIDGLKSSNT